MKKQILLIGALLIAVAGSAQVTSPSVPGTKTMANYIKPKQKTHANGSNRAGTPIWGVGSGVGVADAEFSNAFVQAGSYNSGDNPTSWTALSVHENGGAVTPGAAYWTRSTLGYSQGAYWSGTTPVGSPSQANGVAIFDSDFMDNNGVAGDFGLGTSPSPHRGELISPRIDLTGYTDSAIAVSFFGFYRNFNMSELSVSVSVDDGTTWAPAIDYRTILPNQTEAMAKRFIRSQKPQEDC